MFVPLYCQHMRPRGWKKFAIAIAVVAVAVVVVVVADVVVVVVAVELDRVLEDILSII